MTLLLFSRLGPFSRMVEEVLLDFTGIRFLHFESEPTPSFRPDPQTLDSADSFGDYGSPEDRFSARGARRELSCENRQFRPVQLAASNRPSGPCHRIMNHVAQGAGILLQTAVASLLGKGQNRAVA